MIPTMIVVGIVLGAIRPGRRVRAWQVVVAAAVAAVLWGLVVDEVAGGSALAAVNVGVGYLLAFWARSLWRAALRQPTEA